MRSQSQEIPADGTAAAMVEFAKVVRESLDMNHGEGSRIGYFAALYHGVTKSMIGPLRAQGGVILDDEPFQEMKFFDDPTRLDRFVWLFAKRYFDAYEQRGSLDPGHPWKIHFEYCEDPNSTILQVLTSGANAHMVLDLPMAAISVAEDNLDDLAGDFARINEVLAWQIEACQQQVLDVSPTLKFIDRLPKVSAWVVRQLIHKARDLAWYNAKTVEPDPDLLGSPVSEATTEAELRKAVGGWAGLIARPPLPIRLGLRFLVAPFENAPVNDVTLHLMDAAFDPTRFDQLRPTS